MGRSLQNITSSCTSVKRLRAFTLLELMAGMVASGIVITAIWTALHLAGTRFTMNADAGRSSEEAALFYRTFSTEFEDADDIITEEEKIIYLDSVSEKSITYRFASEYVLRDDGIRTDTFHVTVVDVKPIVDEESVQVESLAFSIGDGENAVDVFLQRSCTTLSIVREHDRHFSTQQ